MPVYLSDGARRVPELSGSLSTIGDLGYDYPFGMDLVPGSEMHEKIRSAVLERAGASHSEMSKRYDSWNAIDETLTAYITLDDAEEAVKDEDSRKPVSIVVPLSYATIETLLTYVVAAFFDDPIFKYEGVGSEDLIGAALLERLVAVQMNRAKTGLQIHTMFRDAFSYGFGVAAPVWTKKHGYRTVKKDKGFFATLGGFVSTGYTTSRERVVKFEGNELYNIDPYCYLPDVSVGIHEVQRGEYVGWVRNENRMEILDREQDDPGFFNGRYVEYINGASIYGSSAQSSKRDRDDVREEGVRRSSIGQPVDVIYQYITIIPTEWGLGSNKYPEKWLFAVAGDQVVIAAQPSNLDHNMFPVAVCAPDYDGYSATPISRLETISGLQTLVNFLYNSHVTNIRKALNDMFVVDPEIVNLNDLRSPSPGKLIRLRRKAWGRGVKDAVEQLNVMDVTAQNVVEASIVGDLVDQATGATDALKGFIRRSGDRRSATEIRETKGSALSRMEKAARIAGLQAMYDLGYMIASHTQQFMTKEQYVKIIGRYEEELRDEYGDMERIYVTPFDILIDYDVEVGDGSLPSSGDPQLWAAIFQMVGANELLLEKFDIVNIFKHLARVMGVKNIRDFVRKQPLGAEVMPDERVGEMADKGEVVPLEDLNEIL